jgi:hypothetical protein
VTLPFFALLIALRDLPSRRGGTGVVFLVDDRFVMDGLRWPCSTSRPRSGGAPASLRHGLQLVGADPGRALPGGDGAAALDCCRRHLQGVARHAGLATNGSSCAALGVGGYWRPGSSCSIWRQHRHQRHGPVDLQLTADLRLTAEAFLPRTRERAPGARPFEKTRGAGRQKVRPKLNTGRGGGA